MVTISLSVKLASSIVTFFQGLNGINQSSISLVLSSPHKPRSRAVLLLLSYSILDLTPTVLTHVK